MRRTALILLPATLCLAGIAEGSYIISPLLSPANVTSTLSNLSLNSNGQVSGATESGPSSEPILWTNGRPSIVNVPNFGIVTASGINDLSEIAGMFDNPKNEFYGYRFDSKLHVLYGLNGSQSTAYAINNRGQVAGSSQVENGATSRAVVWTNDKPRDLGVNAGDASFATTINNAGEVAGVYEGLSGSFTSGAFTWCGGKTSYLPGLGGASWRAKDVNNLGIAAGVAQISTGISHPVEWDKSGKIHDLGVLPGTLGTEAVAINDYGQAVGTDSISPLLSEAVLYQDGKVIDLNTLVPADFGYRLFDALDINDAGQILVAGESKTDSQLFLLSPDLTARPINQIASVPEPAGIATVMAAAGILASRRRRVSLLRASASPR